MHRSPAPSYKLSKYIVSIISSLIGKTSLHILNSKHFVGMIKDVRVEAEEALISRCHPQEIHGGLGGTDPITSRGSQSSFSSLKSTYFSYNGEFYEQRQGAAMGSPILAVVANLYMEFFEELALQSALMRPRFWKLYVDDTCCIMKDEVKP